MSPLALVPTFIREVFAARTLPREPEPDLVMESADQVLAYAHAGRIDGVMSAAYLFHSARISQTIHGSATVLDLACGPATQLAQIAALNPETTFVGVDLSDRMLADAQAHVAASKLGNVSFRTADITRLDMFADASFDAVISTMALHHLPTVEHLDRCFQEARRVLKPGGAIYLADFGRLKSLKSVIVFAYINADSQPHLFSLDYERSLRAAFLKEEFLELAGRHFGIDAKVHSTFKVPFLVLVKSEDRGLSSGTSARLREMRDSLPRRYRSDLNQMRAFFALGGLRGDPFA